MAIYSEVDPSGESLVIKIRGRFDFSSHNDFRNAYEGLSFRPQLISVDMKQASFIDSSALGMLLILRDHYGKERANISIINCNKEVLAIFQQANFSELFSIS